MYRYTEIESSTFQNNSVYIWGSDIWGQWCLNYLRKRGIAVDAFIDINEEKWGKNVENLEILSPFDEALLKGEVVVVVATSNYIETLENDFFMGRRQYFYLATDFYSELNFNMTGRLYSREEYSVFGLNDVKQLKEHLCGNHIVLFGDSKFVKDFEYVFDGILSFEKCDEIPNYSEITICVVCDRNYDERCIELQVKGWTEEKNIINADDLFCLLDEYGSKGLNVFPQSMLRKTIYAPPGRFPSCYNAFGQLNTGGRFSVHPCCTDWSTDWGNLEHNTFEEIWNSTNARIFRLSIINRTYSFCNPNTCVKMKSQRLLDESRLVRPIEIKKVPNLEIGIDDSCNLFCASCRNEVRVAEGQRREHIDAVKDSIIKSGWLDKTNKLLLGGNGEVCFSKVYKEFMFSGEVKREALELRSNGTLLNSDFVEKLLNAYKELSIIISIDAATGETYKQLRRSHNSKAWEMLTENLQMISDKRKSDRIHYFQINMCAQMINYKEIPAFIEMGRRLNVDRVCITPIRNWGTYSEEEFKQVRVYDDNGKVKNEVYEVLSTIDLSDGLVRLFI